MRIPKRLFQIYKLAQISGQASDLWDIGCDHSILARINLREGKFSKVYCVDRSKSSLEKIVNETEGLDANRITLIESDGCNLNWQEVTGSVVVAGVGGNTILKVIASCPETIRQRVTWVLNPFTSIDKFLKEIVQFLPGRPLEKHDTEENGRIRLIFVVRPN